MMGSGDSVSGCPSVTYGNLRLERWWDNVGEQPLLGIVLNNDAFIMIALDNLNDMLEKIGLTAIERQDQP